MTDYVSSKEAAEKLGVNDSRIRHMILKSCPDCQGSGKIEKDEDCGSCLKTGRWLPAIKIGRNWLVLKQGLTLPRIRNRQAGNLSGKPRTKKEK